MDADNSEGAAAPIICSDNSICSVNTDLNVRQCVSGQGDPNIYTTCVNSASTIAGLEGSNTVSW
jgi:hypothetical protein